MATASNSKLLRVITKASPRGATDFADAITAAIVVAGTAAAGQVLPRLAASLRHVLDQRAELAGQVEKIVDAHPLAEVLTSMPGFGVRTAVRILLDVSDASQFLTADTSPPAPAWRRSPDAPTPASETSSQPAPGTSTSNDPCSCPDSPRCAPTPSHDRKTGPGQETNTSRTHLPVPPPLRRPIRHAPQLRGLPLRGLPRARPSRGLTRHSLSRRPLASSALTSTSCIRILTPPVRTSIVRGSHTRETGWPASTGCPQCSSITGRYTANPRRFCVTPSSACGAALTKPHGGASSTTRRRGVRTPAHPSRHQALRRPLGGSVDGIPAGVEISAGTQRLVV